MSLIGCQSNTLPDHESKPENGDLNESFLDPEQQSSYKKDSLLRAGCGPQRVEKMVCYHPVIILHPNMIILWRITWQFM